MSDGPRIPLKTAQRVAEDIQSMLAPSCQRLLVVGSVRREKPTVGDIELVLEPRYSSTEERVNLFETKQVKVCEVERVVDALAAVGVFSPCYKENGAVIAWPKTFTATSRHLSLWYCPNEHEAIPLDLFIQREDRLRVWGWQTVLRTGPGEANQLLVTSRQKGGLLPPTFVVKDGNVTTTSGIPITLETEAQVFEEWHMVYVPPQERSVEAYIRARLEWRKANTP